MRTLDDVVHADERRRYPRFNLRCPVHVSVIFGVTVSRVDAFSRNVSIGGLLLEAPATIAPHSLVSFVITLQGARMVHPIDLAGEGEIVRVEAGGSPSEFLIALKCTRPVSQIQDCVTGMAN